MVTVPKEKVSEAEQIWKQHCAPIMIQQPGYISEQFLRNLDNSGELISVQTWQDQKAIDQYRAGSGHQDVIKHTRELMGVSKVEVKNYEVSG